jgi:hypothetical protein
VGACAWRWATGVEVSAAGKDRTGVAAPAGAAGVGAGCVTDGAGTAVDAVEAGPGVGVAGGEVVVGRAVLVLVAVGAGSCAASVPALEGGSAAVGDRRGAGSVARPVADEDEGGFVEAGVGERVGTVCRCGACAGVAHTVRASEPKAIVPPTMSTRIACPGRKRGWPRPIIV